MQSQITKLVVGLQSGEYSQKKKAEKVIFDSEENKEAAQQEQQDEWYQDGVRPAIFKSIIGKDHQEF